MSDDDRFDLEKVLKDANAFESRPSEDFEFYKDYVNREFPNKEMEDVRFMAFIIDVVLRKKRSISSVSDMNSYVIDSINSFERSYLYTEARSEYTDINFQSIIRDESLAKNLLEIFKKGGFSSLEKELLRLSQSKPIEKVAV